MDQFGVDDPNDRGSAAAAPPTPLVLTRLVSFDRSDDHASRERADAEWHATFGQRLGWAHDGPIRGMMVLLELPATRRYCVFRADTCRFVDGSAETVPDLEMGEEVMGYYDFSLIAGQPRYVWTDWGLSASPALSRQPA